MIERLLKVESETEPTEIVIHVNMLKEGWDVTNLYTIVPLRAANARTLIEQSIGRGLRLPFGKRTGVSAVDRLNIVAHDRFQGIIDEANRGDSPIRMQQVILEAPGQDDGVVSVRVGSTAEMALGLTESMVDGGAGEHYFLKPEGLSTPAFASDAERRTARAVMDVISEMEKQHQDVPTSAALNRPEVQDAIIEQVRQRLTPVQGELLEPEPVDVASVVAKTTEIVTRGIIDIPRIAVVPTDEVTVGFHPFTLDLSGLHLQPADRELVIHHLQSNAQETLASEAGIVERRLEDIMWFSAWWTTTISITTPTPSCSTTWLGRWFVTSWAICPRTRPGPCWTVTAG
jgi:type III restriction enzyme